MKKMVKTFVEAYNIITKDMYNTLLKGTQIDSDRPNAVYSDFIQSKYHIYKSPKARLWVYLVNIRL